MSANRGAVRGWSYIGAHEPSCCARCAPFPSRPCAAVVTADTGVMGEAARRRAAAARRRSTGEISVRDAARGEGQRVRHLLDRYVGGEDSDEAAGRIDRPHNRNHGLWTQLVAERDGMIVGALTVGDIFASRTFGSSPLRQR